MPACRAPTGIWFFQATTSEDQARVGRQAGAQPLAVIYTTDCRGAVARVERAGGMVRRPVQEAQGTMFAHVTDLYGNEFVLVQVDSDHVA
ncbi:MAG TPA: hypothetical protein VFS44_09665 [Gemmatimonadaceae bacterium]|nr:hypothetical protein [Gemmatimonadaceae bacterium]